MSNLVKILSVNQNFIYICFSSTNVQCHLIPNNLRDNTSGKRFISSWTGQNFNQCINFSKCKSIRLDQTHVSTSRGSAYNLEARALLWTCLLVPRRAWHHNSTSLWGHSIHDCIETWIITERTVVCRIPGRIKGSLLKHLLKVIQQWERQFDTWPREWTVGQNTLCWVLTLLSTHLSMSQFPHLGRAVIRWPS